MRVAVLTSIRHGMASRCLPRLAEDPAIDVATIVFCEGHYKSRWKKLRRDLAKTRRIGPLGALVGIRLRRYYSGPPADDLFEVARRHDIPIAISPRTNAPETRRLLEAARVDLGLSLGNAYIAPRVFKIPRHGMLNVHGEILPRFQGAASVIWAIHEGIPETGFTIHRIDRGIDTGGILYRERFPIDFKRTFRETVESNVAEILRRVPPALARVVTELESFQDRSHEQERGSSYTTPTFRQFLHMLRQHRRLRAASGSDAGR